MRTEKLYETDSRLFTFRAQVLACVQTKDSYRVMLNRTAFFPEGGGQPADTGSMGEAKVTDVQIMDGEIWHFVDRPLPAGEVDCTLNCEQRLRRMQSHSGEHIVSGIAHKLYGVENVGFHMGEEAVTVDFDKELTEEQLFNLEELANAAVRDNLPIRAWYPQPEELSTLVYRSKKEIKEAVRLVEIRGIDLCACCAPHVRSTGEVGCIRILDSMRHRGGIRLSLVFGMDALAAYRVWKKNLSQISADLSVPKNNTAEALRRLLEEKEQLRLRCAALSDMLAAEKAHSIPQTEGTVCVFSENIGETALRNLVNLLMEKCGLAAVFYPEGDGFRYIIGSSRTDLRKLAPEINRGVNGRGGGKSSMIMGSARASREEIEAFINHLQLN